MEAFFIPLIVLIAASLAFVFTVRSAAKKAVPKDVAATDQNDQSTSTADSDRDRISDADEINVYGTDPNSYDSDNDGINDKEEIYQGTDPNNEDTDGDRLTDYEEAKQTGTDPLKYDTNKNGVPDDKDLA